MTQLTIFDTPIRSDWHCQRCICHTCLFQESGRCPHGGCYDDHRAQVNPYDKAHSGQPPRKAWSNWKTDQAFWCRGGIFFPAPYCEHYIRYLGCRVEDCLGAVIVKYQDGFIQCGCGDNFDCAKCYERFERSNL